MAGEAARRWAHVVAEAERSDLSLRAFAEARGVNPRTLSWWKWRLAQEANEGRVDFVEARVRWPTATELRVRVGEALVEVDTDTDLELLVRVVRALS